MNKNDVRHTPGPWNWGGDLLYGGHNKAIIAHASEVFEMNPKDAVLVSTAPELLQALRECNASLLCIAGQYGHTLKQYQDRIKAYDSIIAKAEGRE